MLYFCDTIRSIARTPKSPEYDSRPFPLRGRSFREWETLWLPESRFAQPVHNRSHIGYAHSQYGYESKIATFRPR